MSEPKERKGKGVCRGASQHESRTSSGKSWLRKRQSVGTPANTTVAWLPQGEAAQQADSESNTIFGVQDDLHRDRFQILRRGGISVSPCPSPFDLVSVPQITLTRPLGQVPGFVMGANPSSTCMETALLQGMASFQDGGGGD